MALLIIVFSAVSINLQIQTHWTSYLSNKSIGLYGQSFTCIASVKSKPHNKVFVIFTH